jgi:Zn-dependent M32 family carboxypeptidase
MNQQRIDALAEKKREFDKNKTQADEKSNKKEETLKTVLIMADQVKERAKRLADDGYIATTNSPVAISKAWAKRQLKPGDEVAAFMAHASTMVSMARAAGDIGARAQAAYESVIDIVKHPTTLSALLASVDDLENAIKAGRERDIPKMDPISAKSPGAPSQGEWSIKEIK